MVHQEFDNSNVKEIYWVTRVGRALSDLQLGVPE